MNGSPHLLQPRPIHHLQGKLAFQLTSPFIRIYYFFFPWQKVFSGSQDTVQDVQIKWYRKTSVVCWLEQGVLLPGAFAWEMHISGKYCCSFAEHNTWKSQPWLTLHLRHWLDCLQGANPFLLQDFPPVFWTFSLTWSSPPCLYSLPSCLEIEITAVPLDFSNLYGKIGWFTVIHCCYFHFFFSFLSVGVCVRHYLAQRQARKEKGLGCGCEAWAGWNSLCMV